MNPAMKSKVITGLAEARKNFHGSDTQFATSLGINPAVYNRMKKGETEKLLAEGAWISIARKLDINLKPGQDWKAAETPVFKYITDQLSNCQKQSVSGIFCDEADIGKTFTAKVYVRNHKNAVYVDCSQVKSKQKLIRFIAKEFGVNNTGRYHDVYEDLVFYLKTIDNPIVILDEAGDLQYDAFLELKALWNATEGACGWYMMGADGLKEKIRRAIDNKKVGYTEMFSRYGKRYQRATPASREESEKFAMAQAAMIIKANGKPGVDIQELLRKTEGSLRRIRIELSKITA